LGVAAGEIRRKIRENAIVSDRVVNGCGNETSATFGLSAEESDTDEIADAKKGARRALACVVDTSSALGAQRLDAKGNLDVDTDAKGKFLARGTGT
jgi:hypothetical protein